MIRVRHIEEELKLIKKGTKTTDMYGDTYYTYNYICPRCQTDVTKLIEDGDLQVNFCPVCGFDLVVKDKDKIK